MRTGYEGQAWTHWLQWARWLTLSRAVEDSLTDVLHMRNAHASEKCSCTVDQYLHHKRYKGKNAGLLTAQRLSIPCLSITPADPFRTAGTIT